MKRGAILAAVASVALIALAVGVFAQRGGRYLAGPSSVDIPVRDAEFHFIRLQYTDSPYYHRGFGFASRDGQGSGWWIVDWPDADNHFTAGIQRLTRIDTGDPRHVKIMDDNLFDYPWIYATQTGWWGLSDQECARLREYLLRGGYLVTDDMWGSDAWQVFQDTMARIYQAAIYRTWPKLIQ